jgi:ribonuclease R
MKEEIKKENQEFEKDKYVGVFQKSKNFGFVVLDDKKIKTDIYISKKNSKKAKNNQKVVVQILKLPEKNKKAEGRILEILGNINQAGVDMMSLIKEYDLPYEFPESVINEAKAIKQEVSKKDIPNRLDLRNKIIFTVDGEDAKDLDDAVSVEKLKNGNYLLNVSIADVSYYVQEKSKLDKEAIIRGTSIYMLDRVIPMLPKELSNGICSLNQKEDRFAITVLMEINSKGEVVSSDIQKSIIKVTRRMSYKEVQTILDVINNEEDKKIFNLKDKEKLLEECKPYFEHFKRMEELANILKQKREKAGSLNLDIPESKITLNEQGVAIKVEKYDMYFANEIIEQFMLTANETVAEKFYWLEAPFIYRVHEVPDEEKIAELNKFLWNLGYKIKGNKDNIHPKAFAEVLEKVKGKPEERVVSNLILRTLKVARYEAENKGHFGIASKYYCHFTSPIRRYPDLFIHRIISKYLEENYQLKENEIEKYSSQAVKYAERSSEREKIAQKVERDADAIKKAEYMQSKIGEEYEGIISSITSFGMFVELPNTVEGLIRFDDLGNEYFIYDEEKKTLQGEKSKKIYKIGDSIKVRVIFADKLTRKVDFEKISG